ARHDGQPDRARLGRARLAHRAGRPGGARLRRPQEEGVKRRVLLGAVFVVTFAVVLAGAVLVRSPDLRRRISERWRYGTESAGGLLLTLDVAPTGSLSVSYTNVSAEPRSLFMPMASRTGP